MKIIKNFKKQPKIIQILDIVFVILFAYETVLILHYNSIDYTITSLMLFIILANSILKLKN